MNDSATPLLPLLAHDAEDTVWDRAESGRTRPEGFISVQGLLQERPDDVFAVLEGCVQKLGEIRVPDYLVLGRLGGDSIITMGAESPDIDWEAAWRRELGAAPRPAVCRPASRAAAGWRTDLPLTAYILKIKGAAYPDKHGLLQPLLRRWQAGGCSYGVFALPAVHAVIDWKWETYAKRLLQAQLVCFMIWLLSFFSFLAAFQDEDPHLSLRELLDTRIGRLAVVCDVLALLGMAPFVFIEAATVAAYGWGWATAWNVLDVATYTLQIFIAAAHLARSPAAASGWLSIAAAVQCLLLLFRLQYFSRVLSRSVAFFDDIKTAVSDASLYLVFLAIFILGYSAAFQILFRAPSDQAAHEDMASLGRAAVLMVTWAAGNADLTPLYSKNKNPVAACVLGASFVFFMGMILLNLLTGMMVASLERVRQHEGVRRLAAKAQCIDEIDAVIPGWVEARWARFFPAYLFVLRLDPQALRMTEGGGWAAAGGDGGESREGEGEEERVEQLLQGQGEGSGTKEKGEERGKKEGSDQVVGAAVAALTAEIKALREALAAAGVQLAAEGTERDELESAEGEAETGRAASSVSSAAAAGYASD